MPNGKWERFKRVDSVQETNEKVLRGGDMEMVVLAAKRPSEASDNE